MSSSHRCSEVTLWLTDPRHATGGSIPNILPRLSDQELNVTQSVNNTGNVCSMSVMIKKWMADISVQMFEKFSIADIDSAGRGGEYTVQAGFGWTNGVVLILAGEYGDVLVAPQCPDLLEQAATSTTTTTGGTSGAMRRGVPAMLGLVVAAVAGGLLG